MGWLAGWAKRVKITIDHNDIDAALSHFPLLVYISTSSGINNENVSFVFDELQNDANRFKIAVTQADGTTELNVEIEKWVDADEEAWLWVSKAGWTIASGADTDIYLYYDITHANNPNVGDCSDGSAATHAVWDSDFKLVDHMRDKPDNAHTRDSTPNNNDGTKKGANEPIETPNGQIADAQVFDDFDDYVSIADAATLDFEGTDPMTIEASIKTGETGNQEIVTKVDAADNRGYEFRVDHAGRLFYGIMNNFPATILGAASVTTVDDNNLHPVAITYTGSETAAGCLFYVGGIDAGWEMLDDTLAGTSLNNDPLRIGLRNSGILPFNGIIDEVRVSSIVRSPAWIKACNETAIDHLLDWGSPRGPLKISEVGFPAEIAGVPVANIAEVKGVA